MARNVRFLHKEWALVEITQRTFQGRHLLKPSRRLNALAVGCLAHAQKNTGAIVHGVAFLSTHFHILASFKSVQQMAAFMCQLKTSLSIEIGHLYSWPGASWGHRYHSIPVSDEEGAQYQRLRYQLSQGAKENLVMSPRDWPGVHCAEALIEGRPLAGVWIDRTAFHGAMKRGEKVRLADFEEPMELHLEPLPCWSHLPGEIWRKKAAEIVEDIEKETRERHLREGTRPAGAAAVRRIPPRRRHSQLEGSPMPHFHAFTKKVREALIEGYRQFLIAYRLAAERLKAGNRQVRFPDNCFPPRLPFVQPSPPEPG